MAILSPASYNWLLEDRKGGVGVGGGGGGARWTAAENKLFENALAVFDRETPDRWHNVAAMIPGKSVDDVITKYRELEYDVSNIEAGLVPIPGYSTTSAFTLDWVTGQPFSLGPKRSSSARPLEQERKKGVPWTEEEHKLFLMGLKKYGKGDWRNISRNYVVTRTPTQVASHAQKYFIRQLSGGKDKRRASIHDITTNNLNEAMAPTRTPSPDTKMAPSPDKPRTATAFHWNQPLSGAGAGGFHLTNGNTFVPNPYGVIGSYGLGPQSMVFQMQFTHQYPHG